MVPQGQTEAASRPSAQQPATERLLHQMKAQPAKAGVACLLVCVLLVLLLRSVAGPKTAAAKAPVAAAAPAQETIPAAPEALLRVTIPAIPAIRQAGVGQPLPRDIFTVDLRRFPKAGSRTGEQSLESRDNDSPEATEAAIEELRRQAATFRLEGTVTGPASVAFIDGKDVHEGEEYRGFRVVRISNQAVEWNGRVSGWSCACRRIEGASREARGL